MPNWRNDYSWMPYQQFGHANGGPVRDHSWRQNPGFGSYRNHHDPYAVDGRFHPRDEQRAVNEEYTPLHGRPFSHKPPYGGDMVPPLLHANPTPHADNRGRRHKSIQKRNQFNDFSDQPEEMIMMDCHVSARKVEVIWKPVKLRNQKKDKDNTFEYTLECVEQGTQRKWTFHHNWAQTRRDLKVTPGITYLLLLECRSKSTNRVIAKTQQTVRAEFSYQEQRILYEKAVSAVGTKMHHFDILYRCKPRAYWDDIRLYRDGLMETYIKDYNGQPANHINGNINGLFFSARLLPDGSLPPTSPFGDVRMMIHAYQLLDPDHHNYYFADFYCNVSTHYVTIVICRKLSKTDEFCAPRLHRLSTINPFMEIHPPRPPYFVPSFLVNCNVWVEFYYTENIPMSFGRFDHILAVGAGTSRIGGLPNNKSCTKCNLYPDSPTSFWNEPVAGTSDDEEIGDVTLTEHPQYNSSSTLQVLLCQKCHLDTSESDVNDIIESMCGLVDSVCNDEGGQATKDVWAKSDEVVDSALDRMDDELKSCNDMGVLEAGRMIREFAEQFRTDRRAVLSQLTQIAMLAPVVK